MSRSQDLAFLRLLLTSGIDLMTLVPVASECIKRLIPSFSLSLIRVDASCSPQQHYSEYFADASIELFATAGERLTADAHDPAAFGKLLRAKVPYGNLIAPPPSYWSAPIHREFFAPNGIHHVLDVALRDVHGPMGILGIFREKAARPFTRSEVALVHDLYPLLVHAFAAKPLPARYDEIDSAMLVASREGRIAWASPLARRWLQDASGSRERAALIERHVLPEACRVLCRSLAAHQSNLASRAVDLREIPTVTLPVAGGRVRLRAHALAPLLCTTSEPQIGIQMSLEMHRGLQVLRGLWSSPLSPQLRRLALAIWSGKPAALICTEMALSASTLKSYTKDLYARLEVNSARSLIEHLEEQADDVRHALRLHA